MVPTMYEEWVADQVIVTLVIMLAAMVVVSVGCVIIEVWCWWRDKEK